MLFVHIRRGKLSVNIEGRVTFVSLSKDIPAPPHHFCLEAVAPGTKLTIHIDGECEFCTAGKDNVVDFSLVLQDGDFVLNDTGKIENAKRRYHAKRK